MKRDHVWNVERTIRHSLTYRNWKLGHDVKDSFIAYCRSFKPDDQQYQESLVKLEAIIGAKIDQELAR